jgi:uncharacterized membrane protein YcgQ (UPF0703/DUF1980 family)
MTLRNVVQLILMSFGVIGFILGVGALDTLANNNFGLFTLITSIISVILILVWVLLVVRDNVRDTRYPIARYRPQNQKEGK